MKMRTRRRRRAKYIRIYANMSTGIRLKNFFSSFFIPIFVSSLSLVLFFKMDIAGAEIFYWNILFIQSTVNFLVLSKFVSNSLILDLTAVCPSLFYAIE